MICRILNEVNETLKVKLSVCYANMVSINSPFRYPGGKFYARKLILEHLPKHEFYCEPLCGGASIFFAKEKVSKNILNDADPQLTNCLIHIRDSPEMIADFLEGIPATKEKHNYFKNHFSPTNKLEEAARWYYLNRTSYSGIMNMKNCYWGYGDKYSMRPENWRRHLLKTSQKLHNVEIYNKDFELIINEVPDGTFLFVDPPYYNRDQDKFYTHSFSKEDHVRLMEVLKKNSPRINFLVTYDNHEDVREMYSWVGSEYIMDKEWNYMIYRTDDQTKDGSGKEKEYNGKRYKGKEIFILNYNSSIDSKLEKQTYLTKDLTCFV